MRQVNRTSDIRYCFYNYSQSTMHQPCWVIGDRWERDGEKHMSYET